LKLVNPDVKEEDKKKALKEKDKPKPKTVNKAKTEEV
jgi:hypothetical protein